MSQRGIGESPDIVGSNVGATFEKRASFSAKDEKLAGARAGAPTGPFIDEIGSPRLVRTRGGGGFDGIANDLLGDGHFADDAMKAEDIFASEQRLNTSRHLGGGTSVDG